MITLYVIFAKLYLNKQRAHFCFNFIYFWILQLNTYNTYAIHYNTYWIYIGMSDGFEILIF